MTSGIPYVFATAGLNDRDDRKLSRSGEIGQTSTALKNFGACGCLEPEGRGELRESMTDLTP